MHEFLEMECTPNSVRVCFRAAPSTSLKISEAPFAIVGPSFQFDTVALFRFQQGLTCAYYLNLLS